MNSTRIRFPQCLDPVPTSAEMNAWDAESVRLGIPDPVLMENAARAALGVLVREYGVLKGARDREYDVLKGARVLLLMGSGNNGGDAACLARQLLDRGADPYVVHTSPLERAKGSTQINIHAAQACGVPFLPLEHFDTAALPEFDILVDGLLGTGFRGCLRDNLITLVNTVNAHFRGFVLALDIPSGLDSLTGRACPTAVKARATATFAAAKPGLVVPWAREHTGTLYVCDIATPLHVRKTLPCSYRLLSPAVLADVDADADEPKGGVVTGGHKNRYGHVLVIGGAHGMMGAAHLAALAALRAGAGLVTAAAPAAGIDAVRGGRPEIMTRALMSGRSAASSVDWPAGPAAMEQLTDLMDRACAVALGPGLGRDADAEGLVEAILSLETRPPLVVDADALVILGRRPDLLARLRAADAITPHPGEAAALLGRTPADVATDRLGALAALVAHTEAAVLLKGAGSLVAQKDSPVLICPLDVPQLSCAGSGDVLSGLAASLLARGCPVVTDGEKVLYPALEPLARAVVVHACAGLLVAENFPVRGCLAGEIADELPRAKTVLADGDDGAWSEILHTDQIARNVPWRS